MEYIYCAYIVHILCIYWTFIVHILCIYSTFIVHILYIYCAYIVHILYIYCTYIMHILYIYCAYIMHIFYIYCAYIVHLLCIYCTFIVHLFYIYCAYIVHIFCIYCAYSPLPILLPSLDLIFIYYKYLPLNPMHSATHTSIHRNYIMKHLRRPKQLHIKIVDPTRVYTECDALIFCAVWTWGEREIIVFAPKIICPRNLKCLKWFTRRSKIDLIIMCSLMHLFAMNNVRQQQCGSATGSYCKLSGCLLEVILLILQ
jgi:hypothetical protein